MKDSISESKFVSPAIQQAINSPSSVFINNYERTNNIVLSTVKNLASTTSVYNQFEKVGINTVCVSNLYTENTPIVKGSSLFIEQEKNNTIAFTKAPDVLGNLGIVNQSNRIGVSVSVHDSHSHFANSLVTGCTAFTSIADATGSLGIVNHSNKVGLGFHTTTPYSCLTNSVVSAGALAANHNESSLIGLVSTHDTIGGLRIENLSNRVVLDASATHPYSHLTNSIVTASSKFVVNHLENPLIGLASIHDNIGSIGVVNNYTNRIGVNLFPEENREAYFINSGLNSGVSSRLVLREKLEGFVDTFITHNLSSLSLHTDASGNQQSYGEIISVKRESSEGNLNYHYNFYFIIGNYYGDVNAEHVALGNNNINIIGNNHE